jgi:uncharacterized protein YebE (UPF0316 family)
MNVRETGYGVIDWIDLSQGRDQWRTFVNTMMNLDVPKILRNSRVTEYNI